MKYLKSFENYDVKEIRKKIADLLYSVFTGLETDEIDIKFTYTETVMDTKYNFHKIKIYKNSDFGYKLYGKHFEGGGKLSKMYNYEFLEQLYEYLCDMFPEYKNATDMGLL